MLLALLLCVCCVARAAPHAATAPAAALDECSAAADSQHDLSNDAVDFITFKRDAFETYEKKKIKIKRFFFFKKKKLN